MKMKVPGLFPERAKVKPSALDGPTKQSMVILQGLGKPWSDRQQMWWWLTLRLIKRAGPWWNHLY